MADKAPAFDFAILGMDSSAPVHLAASNRVRPEP